MALASGIRIGPYEVTAQIGVGGMGEVYRATDTNLKRQVAIKVLPAAVAGDAERLVRFQREAEVLAALNHPNIAQIHGLEKSGGTIALVMELVEGPTLADRIAQGAIPVDEALSIATQIAEALEAAHEQGIIHRDLKPANIKVRADGTVKVLDFGLAKAMDAPGAPSPSVSQAPTITTPAMMTGVGMILGTAAYMSPEQAKGHSADKRSDVWAFGAVFYEMLTGTRAFEGEGVTETLAAVISRTPDWARLPGGTPPTIRHLLGGCLSRERSARVGDIAAALFAISSVDLVDAVEAPRPRRQRTLIHVAVTLVIAGAAAVGTWATVRPRAEPVTRSALPVSSPIAIDGTSRDIVITPDGRRVVYIGEGNNLVVRTLDALEPTVIRSLGAVRGPFVSPDGQWVGFFDGNSLLKRVPISGGPASLVAHIDGAGPRGAIWRDDGTIIFGTNSLATGLLQVPAAGGTPIVLNAPSREQGELDYLWPEPVPGTNALLFTILPASGSLDEAQVAVFDLQSKRQSVLIQGGSDAHYVPTGHLVYASQGALRAVRFDPATLQVVGVPTTVVPNVLTTPFGAADFDVSSNGTLTYVAGRAEDIAARRLVWLGRDGSQVALPTPPAGYIYPRVSPDGTRIAVPISENGQDIWVWDGGGGSRSRFTFSPEQDTYPHWMPDGKTLAFASARAGGPLNLYRASSDNLGNVERLLESPNAQVVTGVSPNGKQVIFTDNAETADVSMLALDGTRLVTPLVHSPATERNGTVSPDGRWLAYESDESGRFEVYVRPFPAVDAGRWQVSTEGGTRPLWAKSSSELFYRGFDGSLMDAVVQLQDGRWSASVPMAIAKGVIPGFAGYPGRTFDVSPDGKRFLLVRTPTQTPDGRTAVPPVILVQHWFEELKRLVPD